MEAAMEAAMEGPCASLQMMSGRAASEGGRAT